MAELIADRVRVSDLRGNAGVPAPAAVLEDPTGRRRRRLRVAGRVLAVALTLWLVALVLGSVGLSPVPGVPFAHVLRPAGPPGAKKLPKPEQPTASDLEPALPTTHSTTTVAPQPVRVAGQLGTRRTTSLQSPAAKRRGVGSPRSVAVHTMPPAVDRAAAPAAQGPKIAHANNSKATTTTTAATRGRSGTAPGQAGTAPGRSKTTSTGT